ncbi:MAG TPA: hypothetical protein DCY93_00315 [Firmicutes bacterium]|nr:hypothetical protein [Bacillota bacterium]
MIRISNIVLASNGFTKYLWIIILIIVLLIIFGVAFLLFMWTRRRYRKQVADLRKDYAATHVLLVSDCHNMLTRIDFISKNNPRFLPIYNQFNIDYTNCFNSFAIPCDQELGSLESLIKEKEYRDMKELIESAKVNISDFTSSVKKLNEELSKILKREEECLTNSLSVKEQFRSIKESYDSKGTELKGLEASFSLVFNEINNEFASYEKLIDSANYDEADSTITELSKIITALFDVMKTLPYYNTLVRSVIPSRIQNVTETYEKMTKEQYPLHHIQFNSTMKKINSSLEDIETKLKNLQTSGVKEQIDVIVDTLEGFMINFQKEVDAKEKFEKGRINISDDTYSLEKSFAKLNRNLPKYSAVYIINKSYMQQIELIKENINQMSAIKRDIDSSIHSLTKQPYSILLKKMEDLQNEMAKIKVTLDDFHSYLISLKEKSEEIFESIRTNYLNLREAEYAVRDLNVTTLTDEMHLTFEQAYNYLEEEDSILTHEPIDVLKLEELHNRAQEHINSLINEVNTQCDLAKRSEEAIVYGNMLRVAYSEVNKALTTAEKSFFEADFTRATNEAIIIIKKMRPDVSSK